MEVGIAKGGRSEVRCWKSHLLHKQAEEPGKSSLNGRHASVEQQNAGRICTNLGVVQDEGGAGWIVMVMTIPGHGPVGTAAFARTGMPLATGGAAFGAVEDGDGIGG